MAAIRKRNSADSLSPPPLQETALVLALAVVVMAVIAVVPAVLMRLLTVALRAMRSTALVPSSSYDWHRKPARAGGWLR